MFENPSFWSALQGDAGTLDPQIRLGAGPSEPHVALIPRQLDNLFLIDWITIVFHGVNVEDVQHLLSMPKVPWVESVSFVKGYPLDLCFDHIHIRYGAERKEFYADPSKARFDMGICLEMSGQGCRNFESWSTKSWIDFITDAFRCMGVVGARMKITRLDLAYDDRSGLLNIWQLKRDVEDRNYVSKSHKSTIIWSDDVDHDIHGLTIEIGSRSSPVLIRIYDKAAERGYGPEVHWIRVELQLRQDRAMEAFKLLFQRESIGMVASGIIRNYCMFVTPSGTDSNKWRWPIADYWQRILDGFEKIRVWSAPGEEYNFFKSEAHLIDQYAQVLRVCAAIHGNRLDDLLIAANRAAPQLKPKYKAAIDKVLLQQQLALEEMQQIRKMYGFVPDPDGVQVDFSELMVADPDCPWR